MLLLNISPPELIALITALVIGLTVHEFAHAWSAYRLGDPTAAMQGRMTLDPRRHIDPMGAIVFLLVGFGWAKPVPIDPYRLGQRGTLIVSLAGPVSNFIMAAVALTPLTLLGAVAPGAALDFMYFFGFLNIILALFNLLPLAPLDGWKVLLGLVPPARAWQLQQYERYGPVLLLILVFMDRFLPFDPLGTYLFSGATMISEGLAGLPLRVLGLLS